MSLGFIINLVWALVLVALVLVAMMYIARALQRGRLVTGVGRRLISTVESTMLAQNVTVHVVKVAGRYYVVGGGTAGLTLLTELPANEVEPFIEQQRQLLVQQRETLLRPFARFKKS